MWGVTADRCSTNTLQPLAAVFEIFFSVSPTGPTGAKTIVLSPRSVISARCHILGGRLYPPGNTHGQYSGAAIVRCYACPHERPNRDLYSRYPLCFGSVSGAVGERIAMGGYFFFAFTMVAFIYPLVREYDKIELLYSYSQNASFRATGCKVWGTPTCFLAVVAKILALRVVPLYVY